MKKILVLIMLSFGLLLAKNIATSEGIALVYPSFTSKQMVGKLLPTNKFEILEKKNGRLKIKVEGYQNPAVKRALYYSVGKRILVLGLSKNAKLKSKKIGTKGGWNKVSFIAYIPNKKITKNFKKLNTLAKNLYANKCSMCHSLYPAHDKPANQWPSVINAMKQRAGITKDEQYLISIYLQKHAKDMQKGDEK